jgi:hypothetical protein
MTKRMFKNHLTKMYDYGNYHLAAPVFSCLDPRKATPTAPTKETELQEKSRQPQALHSIEQRPLALHSISRKRCSLSVVYHFQPYAKSIICLLLCCWCSWAVAQNKHRMSELDRYLSYLTGDFDNALQIAAERQAGKQIHPFARHISRIANSKILNLPPDFKGVYVIEESYYHYPGKDTTTKHHLFLFSLTDDQKVLLRVQTPDELDNKLLRNDNATLQLDFTKLTDIKRFKAKRGYYLKSQNDLGNGMSFTLEETIGDGFLEVMELLEKDGKRLIPYDSPLQYRKIKTNH